MPLPPDFWTTPNDGITVGVIVGGLVGIAMTTTRQYWPAPFASWIWLKSRLVVLVFGSIGAIAGTIVEIVRQGYLP